MRSDRGERLCESILTDGFALCLFLLSLSVVLTHYYLFCRLQGNTILDRRHWSGWPRPGRRETVSGPKGQAAFSTWGRDIEKEWGEGTGRMLVSNVLAHSHLKDSIGLEGM